MIASLLYYELENHIKVNNTITYLGLFFLFISIFQVFVLQKSANAVEGAALLVMVLPLAQISLISTIFKQDYQDGSLELLLTTRTTEKIVITKFLALNIVNLSTMSIILPIFCILYSISINLALKLFWVYSLLYFYVNAFIMLISAIGAYFNINNNFIATFIFPLIIPGVICAILSIFESDSFNLYITLLIGLNFIFIPTTIAMSTYLIRNIYNI